MKTTEEIKALISEKIAGQGTQVDLGGALPEILNEILNTAMQGGSAMLTIPEFPYISGTRAEVAAALQINEQQLQGLVDGKYSSVYVNQSPMGTGFFFVITDYSENRYFATLARWDTASGGTLKEQQSIYTDEEGVWHTTEV